MRANVMHTSTCAQVKCRDRRGLLSDIVNALRLLPLEIRTAAITTNDGMVRNVFEVRAAVSRLPTPSSGPLGLLCATFQCTGQRFAVAAPARDHTCCACRWPHL